MKSVYPRKKSLSEGPRRPYNRVWSADSWEVTWQDSNKILKFSYFLRFLGGRISILLMHKMPLGPTGGLWSIVKNDLMVKKSRFFKVEDTLTIIIPREKKHLNNVYTSLKWFWGNLRGLWDFDQKSIHWVWILHLVEKLTEAKIPYPMNRFLIKISKSS